MPCHLRSASFPSRPHSNEIKVEEDLHSLNASVSSPSATIETVCDGVRRLGDIYNCMNDIICLPSNQVGLPRLQENILDEELERSLELLDLCNGLHENINELKMSVQELQMALKRGDDAAVQVKLQSCIRLAKKARHHLKKVGNKSAFDKVGCSLVRLLIEARETTLSVLKSALETLSKQIVSPNASKWALISKTFQKRRVACEEVQLQALEFNIVDLESGVEVLFRRLIQIRVSLLNTLSS